VRPVGVVVFEIVLLVVIIVALAAGVVMTSGRVHAQAPTMLVFVEPGQTLWSIAAQHPVDGQTTEQTADMIAEINRVQGGRVMAGDTIAVPVHGDDQLLTASR
jgi:CDP-diacylglycerol pyrophosphatase